MISSTRNRLLILDVCDLHPSMARLFREEGFIVTILASSEDYFDVKPRVSALRNHVDACFIMPPSRRLSYIFYLIDKFEIHYENTIVVHSDPSQLKPCSELGMQCVWICNEEAGYDYVSVKVDAILGSMAQLPSYCDPQKLGVLL